MSTTRCVAALLSLALFGALGACASPMRGDDDDGTGSGSGGGGGSGSNSNADGCSDASKFVYVVDQGDENGEHTAFSRFDPSTKTFTDIGDLACESAASGSTPFSMGVDRDANAWVLYSSGNLYRVDTSTLACTKTTWASPNGLNEFGMGFSTDAVGGTTDQLFIAGGDGPDVDSNATLATVDTSGLGATNVGSITGWPELTGTGNADLWGFFPSDPNKANSKPRIEQINKMTGAAIGTPYSLSALAGDPNDWAFAAWGGDFWVFLQRAQDSSTIVYQISGTNGSVVGQTNTGSRHIVGAGVSTCAPVVIE